MVVMSAALLAALVSAALTLPSVRAPSTKDRGAPYPRIANCYFAQLAPTSSDADLEEIARYSLLIGGVWADWSSPASVQALQKQMAAVRRINPRIIILDFSCSAPYAYPSEADFPADGWLLQVDGKRIDGWPGTLMVDLTKPAVVEFMVGRAVRSVKERGFDGTFIDCMAGSFDAWACNIATGAPYTVDTNRDGKPDDPKELDRLWTAAKSEIGTKVRAGLGSKAYFMTNQAGDWGLSSMNGILLEDYLDYVLTGGLAWDRVLADYIRWSTRSAKPTLTTIVSSSGIEPPFDAWTSLPEPDRTALLEKGRSLTGRMRFGLASTLMGDGYYAYDLHTRWRGQRWWYPEYDTKLGYPKGAAARRKDGTWQRTFDGGVVVVNPTELDAVVCFAGPMREAGSGKCAKKHVVPGMNGGIFVPATAEDTPSVSPSEPPFTLAGQEPIVLRPSKALVRLPGAAAIVDEHGRVTQIMGASRALASGIAAFVVSSPWKDYAYTGSSRALEPDGALRFVCERTESDRRIRQEQTIRVDGEALAIEYRWTALTDARFVMFRHQLDLPAGVYGGGKARSGGRQAALPAAKAADPTLLDSGDTVHAAPRSGSGLFVTYSSRPQVIDERHYGVDAFRVGVHPAPTVVRAGDTWSLTVRIAVAPRG